MHVFFVLDEYTDVEDAATAKGMVDIVKDAVRNPDCPRPEGEILLGELTRQCVPFLSFPTESTLTSTTIDSGQEQ